MRILSVLHPGGGHSGALGERVRAARHEIVEWNPGAGEAMPDPLSAFDALAVFGGGQNLRDAGRLPWLGAEIELIREALAGELPVVGVCLGSQLLAAAAGAEVRRASTPEIGWYEVERTAAGADDPLFGALPERFSAYEWHSYAWELPPGAVELARSPVCGQAFRLGTAWGLTFHPEVTDDIVVAWGADYLADPDAVALGVDPEAATAEALERLPEWNRIGALLFDGWVRAASAAARARPAAPAPPLPRG
jgi:GMP synthase-like glutamine amidotransferase